AIVEAMEEVKPEPEPKRTLQAPEGYYRDRGKAAWDKLDDGTRQLLADREKEIANGVEQYRRHYGERFKEAHEMDQVIAPRAQMLRQLGASAPQVVDNMFKWMELLADTKRKNKVYRKLTRLHGLNEENILNNTPQEQPVYQQHYQPQQQQQRISPDQVAATQANTANQVAAARAIA